MGEGGHGHAHGYHHQLSLHHHSHHHGQPPPTPRSRFGGGVRGAAGEIVEVQGGHIVRSTGRKDRHSKVCTAKGPRDRRVRLSAHTAIQFYDVQDRLGYDRPSKAVDWLIKNAKAAIDELAELPAWHPTSTAAGPSASNPPSQSNPHDTLHSPGAADRPIGYSSKKPIPLAEPVASAAFGFGGSSSSGGSGSSSFIPPSLDSDAIADTIKSFFPMAAAAATAPSPSPSIGFQNYPPPDLLSRSNSQTQDLRLSLQSFQDPIFHSPHHHSQPHHHHGQRHQSPSPTQHQSLFSGSTQLAFDTSSSGWPEQNQRMVPWNVVAETGGGGGDFMFNVPPPQAVPLHPLLGQSHFFSQRGPLQSSNSLSVRAWSDPMAAAPDHQVHPVLHPSAPPTGFASGAGFSGFRIPARIQGEEEHGGMSDKPPSASSASHH